MDVARLRRGGFRVLSPLSRVPTVVLASHATQGTRCKGQLLALEETPFCAVLSKCKADALLRTEANTGLLAIVASDSSCLAHVVPTSS